MKVTKPPLTGWGRRLSMGLAAAVVAPLILVTFAGTAQAAKSEGCEGGGFKLVNLGTQATIVDKPGATDVARTITAPAGGARIGVRGTYAEFDIDPADFAVYNQGFTGAPNALDMTGGVPTTVFASKIPEHRGLTLTSGITVQLSAENLEISRTGTGVSMKLQAKDCAAGGIFQMEPQRSDGTRTRIVHTLATNADPKLSTFYFDNPNFRARIGQFLGDECAPVNPVGSKFCVQVTARVNIANDFSRRLVVRDSAQVATRVNQNDCNTATPLNPSVRHCGKVSVWDVASGGRMGFVTGEDAVEVANPPTTCTHQCQAQNQVRGRLVVLGFPFPVPAGSRLTPNVGSDPLPPLTTP